jgi:E3 ubiquitin-protein ligase RNF14
MASMCQMHVKEGTIQLLKCPDNDCKEFVPIEIMSKVLSQEEFQRWETLMFQRTLDSMEDVMYCPKCSAPIIIDGNNTHAFCMVCNVDFCQKCKDSWHSGACLTGEEKVIEKIKRLNLSLKELVNLSDDQIRAQFKDATGIMKLREKSIKDMEKTNSDQFMKKYVKCPKCKAPIDKFEGCNKVSCICGVFLCYVCGNQIAGYDHFENNSKCNLWTNAVTSRIIERPRHEMQLAVERIERLMPDQVKNLIKCPSCKQKCLKTERNNLIKCWLCFTSFCFQCKKRIIGNVCAHYKNSLKCLMHSD